jgi:hypothetical protein
MRRNLTLAAALTLMALGVACSSGSLTPPSPLGSVPTTSPTSITGSTGTTINASGSLPPSSSGGITGLVKHGTATLTLSGGLSGTVVFATLSTPAVWSPPPGLLALRWAGANGQTFGLGGSSFVGQQTSSDTQEVSFAVRSGGKLVSFHATGGQCIVTIGQAETSAVAGLLQCTGVPSTNGSLTANAQGTFSATG